MEKPSDQLKTAWKILFTSGNMMTSELFLKSLFEFPNFKKKYQLEILENEVKITNIEDGRMLSKCSGRIDLVCETTLFFLLEAGMSFLDATILDTTKNFGDPERVNFDVNKLKQALY